MIIGFVKLDRHFPTSLLRTEKFPIVKPLGNNTFVLYSRTSDQTEFVEAFLNTYEYITKDISGNWFEFLGNFSILKFVRVYNYGN